MLAGGVAIRRITGRGGPSGSDVAKAKKLLRGTGVTLAQAEKRAAGLVDGNRGRIDRSARKLNRRGRL